MTRNFLATYWFSDADVDFLYFTTNSEALNKKGWDPK